MLPYGPLATVLVAVAVAIVGVVVLRGGALVNLRCRVHSESLANLLIPLRLYSTLFSECPLKSLRGLADFDSTMRRFENNDGQGGWLTGLVLRGFVLLTTPPWAKCCGQ